MRYEMREEWGEALQVLDSILEEDEANSSARKRKIAIYKVGDLCRIIDFYDFKSLTVILTGLQFELYICYSSSLRISFHNTLIMIEFMKVRALLSGQLMYFNFEFSFSGTGRYHQSCWRIDQVPESVPVRPGSLAGAL